MSDRTGHLRRPQSFFGSSAAFDSHSGTMMVPNEEFYLPTALRWKRGNLVGKLQLEDLECHHESMHWLHHVATGAGSFLNHLRFHRDEMIQLHLKKSRKSVGRELSRKLSRESTGGLIEYGNDISSIQSTTSDALLTNIAALNWAEDAFLKGHRAEERFANLGLFAEVLEQVLTVSPSGERLPDAPADFVQSYWQGSVGKRFTLSSEYGQFSTWEIMECHASLSEVVFLFACEMSKEAIQKYDSLSRTQYLDPIFVAFEILGSPQDSDGKHIIELILSAIVAIEISLNIYFSRNSSDRNITDTDIYPPTRFKLAMEAVKKIGLLEAKAGIPLAELSQYRDEIKALSGLRTADDMPTAQSEGPSYFEFLSTISRLPGYIGTSPPLMDISLYQMYDYIFDMFRKQQKSGKCTLIEVLANMISIEGGFQNFKNSDPSISAISHPLLLSYDNGMLGLSVTCPLFARQFLHSSTITYPVFSLAFEETISFGPRDYKPVIDFDTQFRRYLRSRIGYPHW